MSQSIPNRALKIWQGRLRPIAFAFLLSTVALNVAASSLVQTQLGTVNDLRLIIGSHSLSYFKDVHQVEVPGIERAEFDAMVLRGATDFLSRCGVNVTSESPQRLVLDMDFSTVRKHDGLFSVRLSLQLRETATLKRSWGNRNSSNELTVTSWRSDRVVVAQGKDLRYRVVEAVGWLVLEFAQRTAGARGHLKTDNGYPEPEPGSEEAKRWEACLEMDVDDFE